MESQLLTVKIGPYFFGAPVSAVTEILADPAITPIPKTPSSIAGVAVVRGQALTVLTLHPALNLPQGSVRMALRWGDHRGTSLIAVDHVESLWTPAAPIPPERWQGLVPAALVAMITNAYRWDQEWLWEWSEDLPDRVQATLLTVN
ncbi:MAG: chemotaxis protein CheW [Sulfobacillus acidophilus]|uniref:Chemotaxis protein CheW n=1 Tax=Sulfobacillus acidophilus TaxID=53633 RepID=A0A2T2WKM3_9FIRM|nr:MAG: chemotaxis protein CheW [Sulfobacillus acidophilus]